MTIDFEPTSFDPARFNPHDPQYIKNPYSVYKWFRHNKPVCWVESIYKSYWVFRYEDVANVLKGTDLWIKNDPNHDQPPPAGFGVLANMPNGIFTADNPRHDEVRQVMEPLFKQAIKGIADAAQLIAKPLLMEFSDKRRFELITNYALPMPSYALCHMLGVPEKDWPLLMQWISGILMANDPSRGIGTLVTGGTTSMALRAYFHALIPGPVSCPVKGRMVDLMATKSKESPSDISADEVIANAVTMSIAGYYSTTFLIGTGMLNLLKNQQALLALREAVQSGNDSDLLASALGEMLRYDGPVQLIDRFASEDTIIGGVKIPRGQKVTVVVGSANWDEEIFPDPEVFDIQRNTEKLLSFGEGIHRCIGEPMFQQVAPVAFRALLTQFPVLELSGLPQWQTDPYLRAISNLPLSTE